MITRMRGSSRKGTHMTKILALGFLCFLLAQATQSEIRVDTFDRSSRRTGYYILDLKTGRLDQFDTHGRRLGYGTVTSPPSSPGSNLGSESLRSVPDPRRTTR